jgi:hypothetical protein
MTLSGQIHRSAYKNYNKKWHSSLIWVKNVTSFTTKPENRLNLTKQEKYDFVRYHISRNFWNFEIVIFHWRLLNLVSISTQITSNKHLRPVEVQTFYKISVLSEKIALRLLRRIVYKKYMNQNDARQLKNQFCTSGTYVMWPQDSLRFLMHSP